MYKSPIDILYGQMRMQIENDIYKAVQDVGVDVDRNELIRALKYDRDQYEKGYADGKADAMADLVRCKDCIHFDERQRTVGNVTGKVYCSGYCYHWDYEQGMSPNQVVGDDFCSYGERKDND